MNPFAGKPGPDGSETISTHFTAVRSFTQRFLRAPVPFHAEILGSGHPETLEFMLSGFWQKQIPSTLAAEIFLNIMSKRTPTGFPITNMIFSKF
ncbi:uncharacterized protein LOC114005252 isoform X2 [Tupaia chinensis]|uniref:uncharacterized protein LOC114005252 isoform X2 n=1 Tax=Tupaia chinensis TaxID=246437 RepID=UPI000FFB1863|nr:uncharacterized protein LOC114005252 isoform X2 [Tupaia chinensis]